eukprot:UN08372
MSPLGNELKTYKTENEQLKKQLLSKDKLLDKKSKQIIDCTSENLRLKQQIQ